MRTCTKCNLELSELEFFTDKSCKDGLRRMCKSCDKAKFARWRAINKERHNAVSRKWHTDNRELCVQRAMKWNREHKEERRQLVYQYKKHLRKATPKWVDKNALADFYRNRPAGYHVDHIIPLRGENVSGLHVLWNLQYLTPEENCSKSNKV